MFFSDDIIACPRLFNPSEPSNKDFTSINKSNRGEILLTRRNIMGQVDTVIQYITDEDGIIEDITIESSITVESVVL